MIMNALTTFEDWSNGKISKKKYLRRLEFFLDLEDDPLAFRYLKILKKLRKMERTHLHFYNIAKALDSYAAEISLRKKGIWP